MAVLSMMRHKGDPDQLLAGMREHLVPVAQELAPKHGGLATIVAKADDGLLIVNLWKEEAGRHAMAEEPAIRDALQKAGLPAPAFEGFEVLDYTVRQDAVTE